MRIFFFERLLLAFILLICFSANAQVVNLDSLANRVHYKNTVSVGFFYLRSRSSFPGRTNFLIVCPSYDIMTPLLRNRLSVGVAGAYATNFRNKINEEFSGGIRVLYHYLTEDIDLYAGPGFSYGIKNLPDNSQNKGGRITYFGGLRYWAFRQTGLQFEINNNRRRGGLTFTLGLAQRF